MKKSVALSVIALLALVSWPAHADSASARASLEKVGIAFTPEAFLQRVAEGDSDHAKLFLEAGMDPSVRNNANRTALWVAVERKQVDTLKALLAAGVKPDDKNAPALDGGKTLAFEAVDSESVEMLRLLADAGADMKAANDYGIPPLAEAARTGRLEMCQILLKAGSDPNVAPSGFSMLYGPINEDHVDVVKLLLESGAKLGEQKANLVGAAKSEEMRALLEAAE